MTRVSAIERNAKTEGKISFEVSRVVADEMSAVFVRDARFDLLQQARALKDFEAKRAWRIIIRREQGKPAQRVTRDDAREQIEVILDHAGMNRLRSEVDHPRSRLGQEQEEEKEAFFVGLHFQAGDGHIDRHRWHDNDRLFVLIEGFDRAPERHEFLLERIKLGGRILRGKSGGQSNKCGIGIHMRRAYRTWQAVAGGQNSKGHKSQPTVATFHGTCQEMVGKTRNGSPRRGLTLSASCAL